jgi:cell division protease FtsH
MEEFEQAKDKVMMGSERRSMVMTEEEKEMTAYHEAGHALVMLNAKGHEPLHKVTIIPRGRALGVTMWLPERDKLAHTYSELNAQLASLFGGRIAEELIYGKENITTGAGNDIQQATNLAKRMVKEFGFSDKLGPLRYESNQEEVFLGHSVAQQTNISDETARLIDTEVRGLVQKGESKAKKIITSKIKHLHIIAKGLLEFETLTALEIKDLLKGKKILRDDDDEDIDESRKKTKTKKAAINKQVGSVPLTAKNTS